MGTQRAFATPSEDLTLLSVSEAASRIKGKTLSPVALVEAYLNRIKLVDERLGSFIYVATDHALEAARQAEREIAAGNYKGPLHGVPFGVKDLFFTGDIPTTNNSRLDLGEQTKQTAAAVEKLRNKGAILIGKMDTGEFASGTVKLYGDLPHSLARNPWDLARFSGGSSTGPGAGIGGRTTLLAIGSDTGGSVRLPAAACGAQGLKPTFGRVSKYGAISNTYSRDCTGPLAWYVADCGIALEAISGFDARDPATINVQPYVFNPAVPKDLKGISIGYVDMDKPEFAKISPEIRAAVEKTLTILREKGATLTKVSYPHSLQEYGAVSRSISNVEFHISNFDLIMKDPSKVGQGTRDRLTRILDTTALQYGQAKLEADRMSAAFEMLVEKFEIIVSPGTFHVAGRFNPPKEVADFMLENAMVPASITGHPALSLRAGFTDSGLPLNVQLLARKFDEAALIRYGMLLEKEFDGPGPRRVTKAL